MSEIVTPGTQARKSQPIPAQWARFYTEQLHFAIVPIHPGEKRPVGEEWNQPGHYCVDPAAAERQWATHSANGMGLLHGPSHTAALDPDHSGTEAALAAVGISLAALLTGPRIEGSLEHSPKPIFRLPDGLVLERRALTWPPSPGSPPETKNITIFELRAGAVQDCLPPTMHPGKNAPYKWIDEPWKNGGIPPLPDCLLQLWNNWDALLPKMQAACPWKDLIPPKKERKKRKPSSTASTVDWDGVVSNIRSLVGCSEVLRSMGTVHTTADSWLCPFHTEKSSSFWLFISDQGHEMWNDSHGGAPVGASTSSGASCGDVIDLYQHLKSLALRGAAIAALAKEIGLQLPGQKGRTGTPKAAKDKPKPKAPPVVVTRNDWTGLLLWTTSNRQPHIRKTEHSAVTVLTNHPAWEGVIGFDDLAKKNVLLKPPPSHGTYYAPLSYPKEWTDLDDTLLAMWFQSTELIPGDWRDSILDIPTLKVQPAVAAAARKNVFHPVRSYLQGLAWDGTSRINTWLKDYAGGKAADPAYLEQASSKWLIQAVARAMKPGCQADSTLILEGKQGGRKSTALKILGKPWYTDELADIGSKDADMQIQGIWIVEIAELDSYTTKTEANRVKQFLTRTTDRFRVPYGRHIEEFKRQCVFAASVNPKTYLRDDTGNRRFWPVDCTMKVDEDLFGQVRDQLWAEALVRYEAKERWWLDDDMEVVASVEQDARMQHDAWEEEIADYLSKTTAERISVGQLLDKALNLPKEKWGQLEQTRVGRCLIRLGWEKIQIRVTAVDVDLENVPGFRSGRVRVYQKTRVVTKSD